MKIKKIFSIVLSLVLVHLSTAYIAADNIHSNQYPYYVQLIINYSNLGEVTQTHKLYDTSNDVIATCLDFKNAYIIYDNNGAIVECSESSKSKYYNITEKTYYGGALNYYIKKDSNYYDLLKKTMIKPNEFACLVANFKNNTNNRKSKVEKFSNEIYSLNGSQTPTVEIYSLRAPSTFNWNTDGTCASLAATIILDHINTSGQIKLPSNYANNPKTLYQKLKYYCETDYANLGGGSSHESLTSGFNKFSNDYNLNLYSMDSFKAASGYSTRYIFYINRLKEYGRPSFIGIPGHMTVGYGGREIIAPSGETILTQCMINNGWGQNGIYVDIEEVDGLIVIIKTA